MAAAGNACPSQRRCNDMELRRRYLRPSLKGRLSAIYFVIIVKKRICKSSSQISSVQFTFFVIIQYNLDTYFFHVLMMFHPHVTEICISDIMHLYSGIAY